MMSPCRLSSAKPGTRRMTKICALRSLCTARGFRGGGIARSGLISRFTPTLASGGKFGDAKA